MGISRWATALAGCVAVAVVLQAQNTAPQPAQPQQPAPPVFRGGVNFVSVDAFPRRDGKVVEGLTKADFQILEDGKPQTLETLEFVHIEPNPTDEARRDPNSQADAERQAADPHNRIFVVYLDLAHTTIPASYSARQPVVDFLTRTIGASDLFAVMTAETPVSQMAFGRRTESIERQLSEVWTWGQADRAVLPRTAYEQRLANCAMLGSGSEEIIRLAREDALHTSLENLTRRLGDLRDERKNILFISEGWVPGRERPAVNRQSSGDIPAIPIGTPTSNRINPAEPISSTASSDRSWCDAQIGRLSSIDFDQRFRALLTMANRANVSFYPIDVGGLKGLAEGQATTGSIAEANARNVSMRGSLQILRTLAENTDGLAVVNTNDLSGGVRRVSDDLSSYYLLGYYSTNSVRDGKYRQIEVKLAKPGVTVTARRGYYASTPAPPAVAAAAPSGAEDDLARLGKLRPDADVYSYGVQTVAGLDVVVELASRAIAAGRWKTGADVKVAVTPGDGAVINATGRVEPGTRGVVVSVPLEASRKGPWQATVAVTGDGDRVQDETMVMPIVAALIGPAMGFRALPSPRSPLRPLADLQLARGERLHVEWPILADSATRVARLLDRKGQPIGAALPLTTPSDRKVFALDLPMASLPEGDFVVDLTATDAAGRSERRLLAFRVVR